MFRLYSRALGRRALKPRQKYYTIRDQYTKGTYVLVTGDGRVVADSTPHDLHAIVAESPRQDWFIERVGFEGYPKELDILPLGEPHSSPTLTPRQKYYTIRDQYPDGTYVLVIGDGSRVIADSTPHNLHAIVAESPCKDWFIERVGYEGYPKELLMMDILPLGTDHPNDTSLLMMANLFRKVPLSDGSEQIRFLWTYHDYEGQQIPAEEYKPISGITGGSTPFCSLALRCEDNPKMVVPTTFLVDSGSPECWAHPAVADAVGTYLKGGDTDFVFKTTDGFAVPCNATFINGVCRDERFHGVNILGLSQWDAYPKRHKALHMERDVKETPAAITIDLASRYPVGKNWHFAGYNAVPGVEYDEYDRSGEAVLSTGTRQSKAGGLSNP
eukprot:TRINITY_DN67106_c1_g1_i3.p1 TRINITY_DN67106_c1_g1~~TRINITY_DN67106_c1_g1_i3.p1  ORF type:complete len:385 (-),score=7.39 TRINITY_DN67106_c1_g1_i3:317-1471(-)